VSCAVAPDALAADLLRLSAEEAQPPCDASDNSCRASVQRRELLISRLQTPVVRLASNFARSRRARAPCASAGLERTRRENPSCLSFESSASNRKTRDRSFTTTVFSNRRRCRFAAHPCRLTKPGPAVQRGGPDSSCYLAAFGEGLSTLTASARKIRLPSNRDNRRSSHEHQRIHRFPRRLPGPKARPLAGVGGI
jgi:hypothetical protein